MMMLMLYCGAAAAHQPAYPAAYTYPLLGSTQAAAALICVERMPESCWRRSWRRSSSRPAGHPERWNQRPEVPPFRRWHWQAASGSPVSSRRLCNAGRAVKQQGLRGNEIGYEQLQKVIQIFLNRQNNAKSGLCRDRFVSCSSQAVQISC
jgi:hypothetical protein